MGGVSNGGVHFQSAVCLVPAPAVGQGGSACFLSRPTRGLPCVLALMNGSFVQPRRQRCDCCCRAGRQEKHSTDFTAFRSAFTPTNGRHTPIMKWSAGLSSHRKGETPASQFQKKIIGMAIASASWACRLPTRAQCVIAVFLRRVRAVDPSQKGHF